MLRDSAAGRARKFSAWRRSRSGATAVEFALVAPLFISVLFGTIALSAIMSTRSAIQQLVAEAARATIAGLSDAERDQLARSSITGNVTAYPLVDPTKLVVSTTAPGGTPPTFAVTISYDMSTSFAYAFGGLLPLPGRTIQRTAVVQTGGY